MPVICLSPLSGLWVASFPQVVELSWAPPVPKPTLESQEKQSFSWFVMMPILVLACDYKSPTTLNPSLLQLSCREASEPISDFHVLRPSEVARYCPSAISECRELAALLITMKLISWPILIPRQILIIERRVPVVR